MRYESRVRATERTLARRLRPRPDALSRVQALMASPDSMTGGNGWFSKATVVAGAVLDLPKVEVEAMVDRLVAAHDGTLGTASALVVMRATLTRLVDWPLLDDVERLRAIDEVLADGIRRDLQIVWAAIERHGLPVAAPELHPPLTWSYATTDRLLRCLVELEWLSPSRDARRDGWPVYAGAVTGGPRPSQD